MKTTIVLKRSLWILGAVILISFTACKSKKSATSAKVEEIQVKNNSVEIVLPLTGKDFQTDKNHFRARQVGRSTDLATAKKISLQNAKSELAGNIQAVIKKVTDQYTNQRTSGKNQDFENKFEELAREVTNQTLVDVKIIGEKLFQEPDGSYSYWVAVEADKEDILKAIDAEVSRKQQLQLDYDKMKFQQIFDDEMKKLEEEQPK